MSWEAHSIFTHFGYKLVHSPLAAIRGIVRKAMMDIPPDCTERLHMHMAKPSCFSKVLWAQTWVTFVCAALLHDENTCSTGSPRYDLVKK